MKSNPNTMHAPKILDRWLNCEYDVFKLSTTRINPPGRVRFLLPRWGPSELKSSFGSGFALTPTPSRWKRSFRHPGCAVGPGPHGGGPKEVKKTKTTSFRRIHIRLQILIQWRTHTKCTHGHTYMIHMRIHIRIHIRIHTRIHIQDTHADTMVSQKDNGLSKGYNEF